MPKRFQPEQFSPTGWATAEEKAAWANAMAAWVLRGFPKEGFRRNLYHHLSTHMYGHIAHFNLQGFYGRWFENIHRQLEWLHYAARGGAYGPIGDPAFTWSDVEAAFSAWVQTSGLIERYQQLYDQNIEQQERAQLAQQLSQYPDVLSGEPAEQPTSDDLESLFNTDAAPPRTRHFRTVDAAPSQTARKRR